MTDAEFEELNASYDASAKAPPRSRRYRELIRRRACCRDCDREDPEFYMVWNELWQRAGGRGVICLACLAKRLGRPLVREDFGTPPITKSREEISLIRRMTRR